MHVRVVPYSESRSASAYCTLRPRTQTLKFARSLARFTDLKFASIVGGEGLSEQFSALADNPDVLVATPGRLVHMLAEVTGLHLRAVQYVVFDEADR